MTPEKPSSPAKPAEQARSSVGEDNSSDNNVDDGNESVRKAIAETDESSDQAESPERVPVSSTSELAPTIARTRTAEPGTSGAISTAGDKPQSGTGTATSTQPPLSIQTGSSRSKQLGELRPIDTHNLSNSQLQDSASSFLSEDQSSTGAMMQQTSLSHQQSLISSNASSSYAYDSVENLDEAGTGVVDTTAHIMNFAMEHKIFLRAILDSLAERDRHAPEIGMNDPNVLKSGPLKKASHLMNGVWKVKYVEIRRGMFSYYENENNKSAPESLLRKNVPLEASSAKCRAVKLHQKALNLTLEGAIFEVAIDGVSKRLWMANSREERQAWMQAIHAARVGGSLTRSDSVQDFGLSSNNNNSKNIHNSNNNSGNSNSNDKRSGGMGNDGNSGDSGFPNIRPAYSPKNEFRAYRRAQHLFRNAKTRSEYLHQLKEMKEQLQPLVVSVKWVAKQQQQQQQHDDWNEHTSGGDAFREDSVNLSVAQLWRDLQRDSISINGELFSGGSGHSPENMMGALTRQLLGSLGAKSNNTNSNSNLSEAQAVEYARDVLLSGNRTRSGGDSYYCVSTLCNNPDLVVIVPNSAITQVEPVNITVAPFYINDSSNNNNNNADSNNNGNNNTKQLLTATPYDNDKSGWIKTRSKLQRSWRKLFFVMSEGTLSYYERAHPRPHRLRGQLVLKDASLSITRKVVAKQPSEKPSAHQFIMHVTSKEGPSRVLLFETEDRLLDWTYALESTARSVVAGVVKRGHRRRSSHELANRRSDNNSSGLEAVADGPLSAEAATKEHFANLGIDSDFVRDRLVVLAKKVSHTTRISIQASTEYNICTTDPQGDEALDTWATLRAEFLQSFRVTGGPNGRIARGEETVQLCITECIQEEAKNVPPAPLASISPTSPRKTRKGRIFRSLVGNDDDHEVMAAANAS